MGDEHSQITVDSPAFKIVFSSRLYECAHGCVCVFMCTCVYACISERMCMKTRSWEVECEH